jgi:hypothetical protein
LLRCFKDSLPPQKPSLIATSYYYSYCIKLLVYSLQNESEKQSAKAGIRQLEEMSKFNPRKGEFRSN